MKESVAVLWLLALPVLSAGARADLVTVLDLHRGSYVGHVQYRTPRIVDEKGNAVPLLESRRRGVSEEDRKPVKDVATDAAPEGWHEVGFDDSGWPRIRGVLAHSISRPGYPVNQTFRATGINRLCARGVFRVTDPAAAGELTLDVKYIGGCVVTVNGKEVARRHLPEGKLTADTLAEAYPLTAYADEDGKIHRWRDQLQFHHVYKYTRQLDDTPLGKLRYRRLDGVRIPAALLRKGLNVVAIEVRTAPVRSILVGSKTSKWPHAALFEAVLSAASSDGIQPNVGPTAGISVQTVQPFEPFEGWDYAHPGDEVRPIRLIAARNATVSGKVLVSSAEPIAGLRASAGVLALEGGAALPASALRVRCAVNGDGMLLESIPEKIEPVQAWANAVVRKAPPTACAALWLTVRVPADAKPGRYRGKLTLNAGNAGATCDVPVELEVFDWRVPDPQNWTVRHNTYQSAESVAHRYKVPLWSDRHFELIGKSFEILNELGKPVLPIHLLVNYYCWGNRESMVRWVADGKGGHTPDFSIADRYMETFAKACGEPGLVYLSVWSHADWPTKKMPLCRVSILDPATGELSTMDPPPLGTAESEAFWRPALTGLRQRLEKRGWFEKTAVVYTSYANGPSPEMVEVYRRIWPDGKWINSSHAKVTAYAGAAGSMPVGWCEWVWGVGALYNPDTHEALEYPRPWERLGGNWLSYANPRIGNGLTFAFSESNPPVTQRFISEACLQGDVNGLGRLGADFWPCITDSRGRLRTMDWAEFGLGFNNTIQAMLSPGPDGAVWNEKLEMFREGLQTAEAAVALQRALKSGKLSPELAGRIATLLDDRARAWLHTLDAEVARFPWLSLEASGWRDRERRLLALAAEVGKQMQ